MRNLNELDRFRVKHPFVKQTETSGCFKVYAEGKSWFVIASIDSAKNGKRMEHLSVSHKNEKVIPTWDVMAKIKDIFFLPDETCIQFHPKHSNYVNLKKNCLHIWRLVGFDWSDWE